jgi:hypothetical protein
MVNGTMNLLDYIVAGGKRRGVDPDCEGPGKDSGELCGVQARPLGLSPRRRSLWRKGLPRQVRFRDQVKIRYWQECPFLSLSLSLSHTHTHNCLVHLRKLKQLALIFFHDNVVKQISGAYFWISLCGPVVHVRAGMSVSWRTQ